MTDAGLPTPVFVTALRLTDFRCHARLAVESGHRPVVILGDNGVGKTNVLEALSLLSPGRGLRRATLAEMVRRDAPAGFAVLAEVDGPVGPVRIGTGAAPGETGREVRIDGEPQKSAEALADHLRVLWLTPAMDGLFTGPAGDRRRFLDRMVLAIDPAHGRRVAAFEQALTGRNRLLEDFRSDPAWLDAAEAQIAELAVAVAAARREAVGAIVRIAAELGAAAPSFPAARVALTGDIEEALGREPAADVEDAYRADLAAARSRDRAAGRTLVGPHRADLDVFHAAKDMPAALSSTGEQKALLINLVLSQARMVAERAGMRPVLLLDEVVAHLDRSRREALFALLEEAGGQAFMTGTDAAPFEALDGRAHVATLGGG